MQTKRCVWGVWKAWRAWKVIEMAFLDWNGKDSLASSPPEIVWISRIHFKTAPSSAKSPNFFFFTFLIFGRLCRTNGSKLTFEETWDPPLIINKCWKIFQVQFLCDCGVSCFYHLYPFIFGFIWNQKPFNYWKGVLNPPTLTVNCFQIM